MENRFKNNFLVIIALIIIVATAFYQAQAKGLFSKGISLPSSAPAKETRTIVSEENAVIDVVKKTSASVVAIGVSRRVINPFDPNSIPTTQDSTIGTGFAVSKDIIVTNKHVVSESQGGYSVVTNDDKKYDVKKIYRDPILDLAIVQIDGSNLTPLTYGDSATLEVGQTVVAIGNALGRYTNTVTTGVVSGLGRKINAGDEYGGSLESLDNLIQTDAAINPGNSGGPLLNSSGQVIGVNVATTEGAQNIGFAIPIGTVKAIIDEFVAKGSVSRPYLGVRYRFISRDVAILNEVPGGAYVQEVVTGGSAEKAGVKAGDIITKINGQAIDNENKISDFVAKGKVGDTLTLNIWRDGKDMSIPVVLQDLPAQ